VLTKSLLSLGRRRGSSAGCLEGAAELPPEPCWRARGCGQRLCSLNLGKPALVSCSLCALSVRACCFLPWQKSFWICASESGFSGGDLKFFSDTVFAGTAGAAEKRLQNPLWCQIWFLGASGEVLRLLWRDPPGHYFLWGWEAGFLTDVLNLHLLIIILHLANMSYFLLLIINNGR